MAKTRIYNDDILIEAVEKYSEQHTSGKIKATKLAEWAQQNIIGLENVRDYHFLREMCHMGLVKKYGGFCLTQTL